MEDRQLSLSSRHSDRHLACQFCAKTFTRRDALNRHWKTCRDRLASGVDNPSLLPLTRGKKRKACDRCVRLKRACNAGLPCSTCLSKRRECSYTNHKENQFHVEDPLVTMSLPEPCYVDDLGDVSFLDSGIPSPWTRLDRSDEPHLPNGALTWNWSEMALSPTTLSLSYELIPTSPRSDVSICNKFEFLARITSVTGLAKSFNYEYVDHWLRASSEGGGGARLSSGTSSSELDAEARFYNRRVLQKDQGFRFMDGCASFALDDWVVHPLAMKTQEIVSRLKDTIHHKPKRSPIAFEWSALMERMCLNFFSPPNICRFLDSFWASWYPNCPIIHKPTFRTADASPSLVAAMVIVGSCLSPNQQNNENSKVWFDSVEEMVFDDDALQEDARDVYPDRDASCPSKTFEALQAAYFVCLFQNWEGSDTSKRRIRRCRYSTIVAITRDLQLASTACHSFPLVDDVTQFEWKRYIQIEQRIRTLSFVFLLDTAFVIFNNTPPRMFVAELEMHINSPEAAFQAESAKDCFFYLKGWAADMPQHQLSISSAIETMCQPNLGSAMRDAYAQLGKLNLFLIISAMCVSVYQLQNSLVPPIAFQNIEVGMGNWRNAWDQTQSTCASEYGIGCHEAASWRRDGFMKSAPEYWLLCRVILHSIRLSASENNGLARRTLEKYDQTDMSQVNDLVAKFSLLSM